MARGAELDRPRPAQQREAEELQGRGPRRAVIGAGDELAEDAEA
ncbi:MULTISPECIES: hypothetical protein [Kytococcus]|nr:MULTISPECIES: hypothetical protein [Kytococcus]